MCSWCCTSHHLPSTRGSSGGPALCLAKKSPWLSSSFEHGHLVFLVKRFVGLRVLCSYSFAFNLVELGECTRIRGNGFNPIRNKDFTRDRKEFLIPLKYTDVTRATYTNLDVLEEKRTDDYWNRVDDYWNVDSNRSSSDSWKGFTKFTLLKENTPKVYIWSGERLTKVQTTTRTDHVLPEVRTKIGKAVQNRENKNGKTSSQNSTLLEDWKESTLLILITKTD